MPHQVFFKTGKQLVMLADEYDKPILDVIENSEMSTEIVIF